MYEKDSGQLAAFAKFGDARLSKRFGKIVQVLTESPGKTIPQAFDAAGVKATYRFFASDIAVQSIFDAQAELTVSQLRPGDVVLNIQDTTSLDFSSLEQTDGLGPLESSHCRGFMQHSGLAVVNGVPVGLLHGKLWARDPETVGKAKTRRDRPIEEKESHRWIEVHEQAQARIPSDMTVITVGDRESDIYELFAAPRKPNAHLLVRAQHNRRVEQEQQRLWPTVKAFAVAGHKRLKVDRSGNRPGREAELAVRFGRVTLRRPPGIDGPDHVELWAVLAEEVDPPAGVEPVSWLLLTTLEVERFEEAETCLGYYAQRWLIERLHFVLKSGCAVESLQLERGDRLGRAVAAFMAVACRVLRLTHLARESPEASCLAVLSESEMEALRMRTSKRGERLEGVVLTMREAVRRIARLGGFMGRKGDGEPGVKTVWRGLAVLEEITCMYERMCERFGRRSQKGSSG